MLYSEPSHDRGKTARLNWEVPALALQPAAHLIRVCAAAQLQLLQSETSSVFMNTQTAKSNLLIFFY